MTWLGVVMKLSAAGGFVLFATWVSTFLKKKKKGKKYYIYIYIYIVYSVFFKNADVLRILHIMLY